MHYISNTDQDKTQMLAAIGAAKFEDLIAQIPKRLQNFDWKMPPGISELELTRELAEIGHQNRHFFDHACYLGAGNYDHYIPAVVGQLAHRGEFITSYTPYQGEASQGTLQSVYEYQSLICELTGMDFSNASMYDGASSLAEACLLAIRSSGRKEIVLPRTLHPEYKKVVKTYLSCLDVKISEVEDLQKSVTPESAAVVVQQPNFFGNLEDVHGISQAAHAAGALLIACVNPISLGILEPPGEVGADIAVGEGQPLGNPVSFGGPHFGFFTVKEALLRKIPGRITGITVDKVGRRSFVLTLQAREQHIRREKATSNICTNHSLCALKAAIYLCLLGQEGIQKISLLNLQNAHEAYDRLLRIKGVREFSSKPFFNEFVLWVDKNPESLRQRLREQKIIGPLDLQAFYPEMLGAYLFAVTENRTQSDLERLVKAIEAA